MSNMTANSAATEVCTTLFSELSGEWRTVPLWVECLIQFGYRWGGNLAGHRRIALVSMPCDSAAAGLIGLGALIRELGNPNANNFEGHYDALLRYARQYLESCRSCKTRCNPQLAGCGYSAEATGLVRYHGKRTKRPKSRKGLYSVSERTDFSERRLVLSQPEAGNLTWWPDPQCATELQIDGEPLPEIKDDAGALPDEMYPQIVAGAPIIRDNLRRSFSGLCLAGRVTGETATREVSAGIRFRGSHGEYSLPVLLAVHGWSSSNIVSRTAFFNTRTERLDRRAVTPSLVVADGDASVLKVLSHTAFQRSDVIGVIHRTIERDRMEAIGAKMTGLQQWYVADSEMISRLPVMPRGINISILKKRTS